MIFFITFNCNMRVGGTTFRTWDMRLNIIWEMQEKVKNDIGNKEVEMGVKIFGRWETLFFKARHG